ncbi:MAG TPA: NAD(P)/FAD-dependent oxidoreductase [Myxococcaceae bacterium]|nr:NAD(P)/FAD-dependent oxidoreductase [Myxococcaceae bacterium]
MREPLVIVGAGPVGSLLALTLARRGFDIEMYERRPDLRREKLVGGRSINLALSTRGIHALERVGMEEALLAEAIPMYGRMMHAVDGTLTFQRYGTDDSQFINSLSRGGINARLLTGAEASQQQGGGRVRIHFEHRLLDYDFRTFQATFHDEASGGIVEVHAPIIFGTDGTGSALRGPLQQITGGVCRLDRLDAGYKELTMPPALGEGMGPDGRFQLEPNALHIWPRGRHMLIALPNPDGNFTCTLFLPFTTRDGGPSFDKLTRADQVEAFFQQEFPDALVRIPHLGRAFETAPLGQMVTVHSWPWSHGCSLLLGDASHGIVPFFGQGMNAGFEDVAILDEQLGAVLETVTPDAVPWAELFASFAENRREDALAIAELAVGNFEEMRDHVGDPHFLLQKAVEVELLRRYPGRAVGRYGLVTFSRAPYRVARDAGLLMDGVLQVLCEGKTRLEEIDFAEAERLLETQVVPRLEQWGIAPQTEQP